MHYRITKYDPQKRNELGHYTDFSEWTSISDIGKNLTYDQYKNTENTYVSAIIQILKEKNIENLEIESIELQGFSKKYLIKEKDTFWLKDLDISFEDDIKILKNGSNLSVLQIEKTMRLILREILWMILMSSKIKIEFGYDYYMYVTCAKLKKATINSIEKLGLYIEPGIARPIVEIIEN